MPEYKKIKKFDIVIQFLSHNFSSPTHWPEWNLLVSRHYETDFYYFGLFEKEELIGICPVHEVKTRFLRNIYSGQFHYIPFGGWIFSEEVEVNRKLIPVNSPSSFQSFSLPLLPEYNQKVKKAKFFKTLVIDLRDEIDSIWKEQLDSKRRNMIRKAEKNSITLCYTQEDFNSFYNIYRQSAERTNLPLLKKEFFGELFLSSKNIGFEVISAQKENHTLANVVIAYDKNYSIYWLGNSADGAPNLGQGELLQWEAIKRMKMKGCTYYDLCYIEKERLPHIYKFKKGFSTNEVLIPYIQQKTCLFRVINRIQKIL